MRPVVLAVVLVGLCGAGAVSGGMERIALTAIDGNEVYVDSLLVHGPVVLNFWATWCRPCRVEMPKLQRIEENLGSSGVHFAAISLDVARDENKVRAFIEQNEVSLAVYRDPEGVLAKKFGVVAIPTTILLDQAGEVAYRTRGYRPGDEILLRKEIKALIERSGKEPKEEPASQ
jgi:thiol-disulfide isomerase/thioredoxin